MSQIARDIAASRGANFDGGSVKRAFAPSGPTTKEGRSAANATSSSGVFAIARIAPATARLKGSCGASRGETARRRLEGRTAMIRLLCARHHGWASFSLAISAFFQDHAAAQRAPLKAALRFAHDYAQAASKRIKASKSFSCVR